MPSERERIDHYRITRKLGQGGMGIVYAAHDERLDRQVAIKMILDAGADVTARERFWREARAAAAVSHPHVCQLYEIGETEGQLYIVMELLEGQSLDSRLESGPIDVPEALTTSLSILGALATGPEIMWSLRRTAAHSGNINPVLTIRPATIATAAATAPVRSRE